MSAVARGQLLKSLSQFQFVLNAQVVVHNLPWNTTWQQLKDAFVDTGTIERADVIIDSSGRSRWVLHVAAQLTITFAALQHIIERLCLVLAQLHRIDGNLSLEQLCIAVWSI